MNRHDEVEALMDEMHTADEWTTLLLAKIRTLADEVDELRGKLDDVRMGIGCARGQRTTQYCADLMAARAERDEYKRRCEAIAARINANNDGGLHLWLLAIAEGRDNG